MDPPRSERNDIGHPCHQYRRFQLNQETGSDDIGHPCHQYRQILSLDLAGITKRITHTHTHTHTHSVLDSTTCVLTYESMRSDDELSFTSNTSRSRGSRSLPGAFAIDWDEIDNIAEESLSVCSSASSGHRKRKNATVAANQQRRSTSQHHLEALEIGSPGGFSASRSRGRSAGGFSGGDLKGADTTRNDKGKHSNPTKRLAQRSDGTRKMIAHAKRLALIGGLSLSTGIAICFFGSYLTESLKDQAVSFSVGDRQIRRLLTKSAREHSTRHWPISVRDEENDFELIHHPGNIETTLAVPRFYLTKDDGTMQTLSQGNGITKTVANMIRRTSVDGSLDFSVRTIFVGVASFRDWHCR